MLLFSIYLMVTSRQDNFCVYFIVLTQTPWTLSKLHLGQVKFHSTSGHPWTIWNTYNCPNVPFLIIHVFWNFHGSNGGIFMFDVRLFFIHPRRPLLKTIITNLMLQWRFNHRNRSYMYGGKKEVWQIAQSAQHYKLPFSLVEQ